MKLNRANLTQEKKREQNEKDKQRMRCGRDGSTKRKRLVEIAIDDDDLSPFIDDVVRQAKKRLHRTKHPDNSSKHKIYVCVVCDYFIIGTEPLRTMSRKQLKAHKKRLGVHEYEQYHEVKLNNFQISQYHV